MYKVNNKGITLIALVVTIIVLIIVASITFTIGRELIDRAKAENVITNMLIIKSKARIFAEEVEGKTWDYGSDIEDGITKKEKGRREIFTNEYNYILVTDSNKTQYKMKTLENDSVYYALSQETLDKMGLKSLWENNTNYYVVKYRVVDNKYEDINVFYTKGVSYNKNMYYDLDTLQSVVEVDS